MGFFWTSREPEEAKWFGKHVFITGEASSCINRNAIPAMCTSPTQESCGISMKHHGRVFWLTSGGSEGIGFALAQLFVEQGAKVTLASRSKDKLEHAQTLLQATSAAAQLLTCATDVGSWEQASHQFLQLLYSRKAALSAAPAGPRISESRISRGILVMMLAVCLQCREALSAGCHGCPP